MTMGKLSKDSHISPVVRVEGHRHPRMCPPLSQYGRRAVSEEQDILTPLTSVKRKL